METLISKLKAGDKLYTYNANNVRRYDYLCVHPKSKSYHILIDGLTEEPIRMYKTELERILEQNFSSYDEAALAYALHLEDRVKSLRERHNFIEYEL